MFDLLTSAKSIFKSISDIKSKQLLLHFIFKKLELKEGIVNYKLKSPFCYTKVDGSMSNMYNVYGKSVENCEPIENKGLNSVFSGICDDVENEHCEQSESLENKGLPICLESPVQIGCLTWIRTKINGVRVRCPTIRRSSNI